MVAAHADPSEKAQRPFERDEHELDEDRTVNQDKYLLVGLSDIF